MRWQSHSERGFSVVFVLIIFLAISTLAVAVVRWGVLSKYEQRYSCDLLRVIEAIDVGKEVALSNFPSPVEFELVFEDLRIYSGEFEKDITNQPSEGLSFVPAFSSEEYAGLPLSVSVTAERKERTGFARRAKTFYYLAVAKK